MDIDSDVDGKLAQELRCLGTSDHDALVQHFIEIVGSSFYDYRMRDQISIPSMTFIRDETVGEGESIPPNTSFVKVWRVANSGSKPWPPGCMLRLVHSEFYIENRIMEVKALQPGEEADISVTMVSPAAAGVYQSRWKMATNSGYPFGETIWCIILVEESGLLGVTQMMAKTSCTDGDSKEMNENVLAGFRNRVLGYQGQGSAIYNVDSENAHINRATPSSCNDPENFSVPSIPVDIPGYTMDDSQLPPVPPCTPCSPFTNTEAEIAYDSAVIPDNFGDSNMEDEINSNYELKLLKMLHCALFSLFPILRSMSKISAALSGMSAKMMNKFASPSSRLGKIVIPAINASKPKLQTFFCYAKIELMPPSIGEWPKIVSEVNNFRRNFNLMDLTVKEAIVYSAVAFEVLMWFFAGEVLGRRHLLGYYIAPNFQPIFIERFQDWKEPQLKEE
ncbi:Uncharacterized protein T4B_9498 [Trichinella pseudospiralis]|uniref:Nbr1 FW domain-containing protein n=1 Tax=Trichinella pseudospiralis TaxID=6337 RepID=A0A0V1IAJ6_TRIPS|nr:Uncharacterized protein T4A_51 [Trichinella pseudospiralis]KRZ19870.1 Uncharacterized protein T4B_9498 [Trichinella pseudospiralis]KRZ44925.1 Uncharacterized protein T4C_5393 [Trichinella pseudospiralis]